MPPIILMPDNTEPQERDSSPLGHNYFNVKKNTEKTKIKRGA